MAGDLTLSMKLYADAGRFVTGLTRGQGAVAKFGKGVKRELDAIKSAFGSVAGQLASLGVSVGAVATLMQSARMDKALTTIGQTAGMSKKEVAQLRGELYRMAGETGQGVDNLRTGFDSAVAAGLNFKEALPVLDATNKAVAVTGANAESLTAGLTVAAGAFDFDLTKPNQALGLLDKMMVAGRLGTAELGKLSMIFGRVGQSAGMAGLSFDKTLGFIEALSQTERSPERLATLTESTLRLFTDATIAANAAKATGVKFFDKDKKRRDPLVVLTEFKKKYDVLKTDADKTIFFEKAFGKGGERMVQGMRLFMSGATLTNAEKFSKEISGASGAIEKDLPKAIANAVDQTGRLKAVLGQAADSFAQPVNNVLQELIAYGLNKKEQGGLELSGKQIIGGGALAAGGLYLAGRFGGKALGGLTKKFGGAAAGIAEGKAVQAATGVTPVFITNWNEAGEGASGSLFGDIAKTAGKGLGLGGTGGLIGSFKGAAVAAGGGGALAASLLGSGFAGYAVGSVLNKAFFQDKRSGEVVGEYMARIMEFFGSEDAKRAREINEAEYQREMELAGKIDITLRQDGGVSMQTHFPKNKRIDVDSSVDNGRTMGAP
jgi:TP901 family phage tail tape measure protein